MMRASAWGGRGEAKRGISEWKITQVGRQDYDSGMSSMWWCVRHRRTNNFPSGSSYLTCQV